MTAIDATTLRKIARDPRGALAEIERHQAVERFTDKMLNPRAAWWECWLMPPDGRKGYSQVSNWRSLGEIWAHRLVAVAAHGPIPDGHEVDHLCFTRNCVNPFHLRIIPVAENRRRRRLTEAGAA